jgi:putative membrane protein
MLIGWIINAAVLLALPYLLKGVQISGFGTALVAAAVIGLLNVLIKPVLFILTLPINLLTLGLFTFVLNGLMFWLAAQFLKGLSVDGFWWAVAAAFVYSIISWAISSLVIPDRQRISRIDEPVDRRLS